MLLWSFEGERPRSAARRVNRHLTTWAVIAAGKHLFPFRTEKLSPLAPMVLGEQSPGRVGRRPFLCSTRDRSDPAPVVVVVGPRRSGDAQLLAPVGVELAQALDALAERRVGDEERREPSSAKGFAV